MFYTFAIGACVLLAVVLGYAATRPDTFRVQRTTSVQAPPEKIYPLIDDFNKWSKWSPYEKLDPSMKRTLSGTERGKGAVYQWAGNKKAGEGRMEITDTVPSSKVLIKLDFLKPFEGHNTAEFTLDPANGSTKVTWAMYGPVPYMMRVMSMFFSMDQLVGKDFELGLANMKAIAES
jgi:hypothetical protein